MAHTDSTRTLANVSQLDDPDMQAAPIALARAAMRARELAFRTGTPLVVVVDGQLILRSIQKSDLHPPQHSPIPSMTYPSGQKIWLEHT